MTIPQVDTLFILAVCGLSTVCFGFAAVLGYMVLRFTSAELFEAAGGVFELFGGGDKGDNVDVPAEPARARRDLRARAQQYDFDAAVQQHGTSQRADPNQFGENAELRPDRRRQLNEKTRDWNLQPRGDLSDNPDVVNTPDPPDFNRREHLPNTTSNVGGRVGRWNTGRGQKGQRMDSKYQSSSDGIGHRVSRHSDEGRRADRNAARDDERFGGQYDFDGDGDLDT